MDRATLASSGRLHLTGAGLAVLAVAVIGPVDAQQGSSACRLLQVSELAAAIGGKASTQPAGSKQSVPGMTLDECSVALSASRVPHQVSIRIVTDLGMDGAEAIKIRNAGQAREQQWKVAGARLEQAPVGRALCILAGRPSVPSHTVCSIPRGAGYVEVDVTGDVDDLPSMATVGALVQQAMARL